jgi:aminopeptidase N
VFRLNREGIKYLEEYFDYKFPFPKYDIVLIPEFPFGGMEHAGATFLRESSIIFPSEPTANDYISRANVIFHEAAHQWFGDTATMRWFDDLWLKEGFAEFMAYKTLERVMPQYNAWKAFYERNKPAAYATDSTRGTTPIYQEIPNLSAAKSAYGNIVYRKAPSFLRQAEFYLGPEKFQTAVRAFLKKHEFGNAGWEDLVKEFEAASGKDLGDFAENWVKRRGLPLIKTSIVTSKDGKIESRFLSQNNRFDDGTFWTESINVLTIECSGNKKVRTVEFERAYPSISQLPISVTDWQILDAPKLNPVCAVIPNYQDYGYGIFLLDDKSRDYVLKNIQNEKDDFLRSMMWGTLWDSVREGELDPREYVELAIKNIGVEKDELTIQTILGRVSTAMTYYIPAADRSEPPASEGGAVAPSAGNSANDLNARLENLLIDKMRSAPTLGQRVTFYRAFLNIATTENARKVLKDMLRNGGGNLSGSEGVPSSVVTPQQTTAQRDTLPTGRVSASVASIPLKTKDRFDIVTKLAILGDPDAPELLAGLEKSETSDDAKRYAYAARAAFPTKENREKFWNDFVNNKDISESWIEAAMGPFNSPRHSELSLPYLPRALAELPNLKRSRKIFFVNGWLAAFIGGQKSQEALDIVNKFLVDNPGLDRDLRLKVLENVDVVERAVKIRRRFESRL